MKIRLWGTSRRIPSVLNKTIRELVIGNENGKKAIGLDWQNNNFARASHLFVHFFAVAARVQRENALFQALSRTWTQDNDFLFLFLKFDTAFKNSTPAKCANIWRIERVGIKAIKFEVARIHFLSDVFVTLRAEATFSRYEAAYEK